MPSGRAKLHIEQVYDAQARAITVAERIRLIQVWVRGQERRGYADSHTAALIVADLDDIAAQVAAHRAELAALRNGGKP